MLRRMFYAKAKKKILLFSLGLSDDFYADSLYGKCGNLSGYGKPLGV